MTRRRTTVLGLVAVTVVITLPGLLLTAADRSDLAGITALAAIAGVIPALAVGARIGVGTAVAVGVASWLSVLVAHDPWLSALLMASLAGAAGLTSRLGASNAVVIAPISVAFLVAQPPTSESGGPIPAAAVGAVALGAALWAALAGSLLMRSASRPPLSPLSWGRAAVFAAVLATTVGLSAWFVVDRQLGHGGAWFLMTLMIVLQPSVKDAWTKTIQRAAGTVVGFGFALLVDGLFDLPVVIYLLAAVFTGAALVARIVQHRPYWQFVALLTPAVVLLEGGSGSILDTALERLAFTLLGAAVAVAVELLVVAVYRVTLASRSTAA